MIYIMFLIFISSGCHNGSNGQQITQKDSTDGLWMNKNYIDSIKTFQAAKWSSSNGFTEIYLNGKLSYAYVLDGDWEPKLYNLQKIPDGYFIYRKRNDSGLTITIHKGSATATKSDGKRLILTRPDTSTVLSGKDFKTAIRETANKILVEGKWLVTYGPREYLKKEVHFFQDGHMDGLDQLSLFYEICLTGECKRYCDEADIIYMSPLRNEPGGYWHAFQRKGNQITIWKVKSLEWMSNWPDIQPETLWLKLNYLGPIE